VQVSLIYANKTPGDILLKDKLDSLAKKHSNFKVHYVVEKKGALDFFSSYSTGYITSEVLQKHCPGPSEGEDILVTVCGPPPMMKAISGDKAPDKSQGELSGLLAELGYTAEQVYKF
jgi:cytochrome-b5 reductase